MTKKKQYLAVFASTLNMISYGMAYGWPSPSLPKLFELSSMHLTHDQGSWLTVMPFVGALFGCPVAAVVADKCGRKFLLLFTAIPYAASWLIIGFFERIECLMFARVLAGVGGGGLYAVLPIYIAEISGPTIRGKLGTWLTTMWNFGVLLIFIGGPFLPIKTMAFISTSVPVLFVLCFIWMPESPYFYMLKGRKDEAKRILTIFREDEDIDKIIEEIEEEIAGTRNIWDILKNAVYRKSLILVVSLITIQEFSGRSPFVFYSQTIFQEADKNIPAPYVSIFLAVIQLISSFSASFIVDKCGRKPLLLISCVGTILCSTTEGTYFFFKYYLNYNLESIKWLPVISLILFIIIFNVGLGIMPVISAGELLATQVRSSGLCILDLFDSVVVIVVAKYFQFSSDAFGVHTPFWTFAFCTIIGIIIIVKFLPETKGLSLEEIQKLLKS